MKKLGITLLFVCIVALTLCLTVFAASEDTTKGMVFSSNNMYTAGVPFSSVPSTYEATLYFKKSDLTTDKGGVIMGSYISDSKAAINFEVTASGNPRMLIINNGANKYDILFDKVSVVESKWVKLAITLDNANKLASCYVNGELKQTQPIPSTFGAVNIALNGMCLGSDASTGNENYFKGVLKDFAFYSDVRTAQEISSDATAKEFDQSELLGCYDFSDHKAGELPQKIVCKFKKGINFVKKDYWITDRKPVTNYDYSIALIGDIQSLTYYYPEKLTTLYTWLKDNTASKKIGFAVGLGDISETNALKEYEIVKNAHKIIQGTLPFSIIRGNHDRNGIGSGSDTNFKAHINQKEFGSEITGSYDNTMMNTYRIIQIGNVKYMFMNLDFLLKNEVLDWANKIISENQDCCVIVSTHIYFTSAQKYYPLTGSSGIGTKYGCINNGQDLWDKLLKKHENISMLICGHNPTDNITTLQKRGEKGNKVTEMLVDPQQTDKDWAGGTGLVAMMYLSNNGKNAEIEYYSVFKDALFLENNQMTLKLHVPDAAIVNKDIPATTAPEADTKAPETTVADKTPTDDNKGSNNTAVIISAVVTVVVVAAIFVVAFLPKKKKEN